MNAGGDGADWRKVVFVGDAGCGKSSLLAAICGDDRPRDMSAYEPTVFNERSAIFSAKSKKKSRKRDNQDGTKSQYQELQVILSDTSGDEGYDRLRPLQYLDAEAVVVCFAINQPNSLRNIMEKWRSELRHFLPGVRTILVGCKSDRRDCVAAEESSNDDADETAQDQTDLALQRSVTRAQGKLMAWSLGAERYVECSAANDQGLKAVREAIFDVLLNRDPRARWKRAAKLVMLRRGASQGY